LSDRIQHLLCIQLLYQTAHIGEGYDQILATPISGGELPTSLALIILAKPEAITTKLDLSTGMGLPWLQMESVEE